MKNKQVNDIYIFLAIIALTVALRWPSFFPSSIDWDEGTFILIGQSVLDGHLPYTELWDVKPPLLFFVFAAIVAISNKSIIAIRIIGSLFVAVATFFVYRSGRYLGTMTTGLMASILFVVMTGESGGKAIMSEIIAAVPLTVAFFLMITQKEDTHNRSYFWLGFLLSLATLVRLNLAYLELVILLYYIFLWFFKRNISSLTNLFYLIGGIVVPIVLVIVPYLITDNLQIFYKSVIEASLSYSTSQISKSDVTSHFVSEGFFKVNLILWIGFFGGLILIIYKILFDSSLNYESGKRNLILLLIWLITIGFSIASIGNIYVHYIIQILPFMTITSGMFFSGSFQIANVKLIEDYKIHSNKLLDRLRYALLAFYLIGLLDFMNPLFVEHKVAIAKLINGISLQDDAGYQVANFLKAANPDKEPIYMMDFQIAQWLTDIKLIDNMVAHPSNISKDYLLKVILGKEANAESEMRKILNKRPLFVIYTKEILYLETQPKARKLLLTTLKEKYMLVTKIKTLYIYKRQG